MLVAVTCLHGRAELTRVFLRHTLSLGLPVFAAVTRGDEENIAACREHYRGVHFTLSDNMPLGAKHNAALSLAMGYGSRDAPHWDGAIMLPSDDLVSQEWVEHCDEMLAHHDYIIPTTCGVYDTGSGLACMLEHGPADKALQFGAGITISRPALNDVHPLWFEQRSLAMDTNNHFRLLKAGVNPYYASMKRLPVTDVKTKDNLTPFRKSLPRVTMQEALWMLSEEDRDAVVGLNDQVASYWSALKSS